MKSLAAFMGIEPGRLHFSWISSAESTKFVEVVTKVVADVKKLGPNKRYVKHSS
jgi:coenzyme F420-reducing hydrogenase delta subunit